MTIQEAIHKAVKAGYQVKSLDGIETYYSGANTEYSVWTRTDNDSSFMLRVEETFMDPAFWSCLCGTEGRRMAHTMIDHLFDGGSAESFFRAYAGPGTRKPRLPDWWRRASHCVQVYTHPRYVT